MWFKRRKKSGQDDALSESLRSLQSLLSETDRREPSLESGDTSTRDEPRTRESGQELPRSAETRADPPDPGPDAQGSDSNRWRDLSLSFDAEPVIPRRHRAADAGDETADSTEPEAPAAPSAGPDAAREPSAGPEVVDEAVIGADGVQAPPDDAPAQAAQEATSPDETADTEAVGENDDSGAPGETEISAAPGETENTVAPSEAEGATALEETEDTAAPGEVEDTAAPWETEDTETPGETEDAAAPGENVDTGAASTGAESHIQAADEAPAAPEPHAGIDDADAQDEDIITYDLGAKPVPPPRYRGDTSLETGAPGSGQDEQDDDILVLDLDAETLSEPDLPDPGETSALSGSTPASPAAAAEPALPRKGDERTADSSAESASQEPDSAQSAAAPAGSALRQAPMAETDQETEDQLNLELDEEAVDADIPVLTNAVYVPVEASAEGAPAAAPISRHEPRIRQCVAALRSRLRDGGLEPLSDDQEQELRAVLVELFEDIDSD